MAPGLITMNGNDRAKGELGTPQLRPSVGESAAGGCEETTHRTQKVTIERKTFLFSLKENARGRFLRITEDVGGRRDTIIIPSTGLADFKQIIDAMVQVSEEIPLSKSIGP